MQINKALNKWITCKQRTLHVRYCLYWSDLSYADAHDTITRESDQYPNERDAHISARQLAADINYKVNNHTRHAGPQASHD